MERKTCEKSVRKVWKKCERVFYKSVEKFKEKRKIVGEKCETVWKGLKKCAKSVEKVWEKCGKSVGKVWKNCWTCVEKVWKSCQKSVKKMLKIVEKSMENGWEKVWKKCGKSVQCTIYTIQCILTFALACGAANRKLPAPRSCSASFLL